MTSIDATLGVNNFEFSFNQYGYITASVGREFYGLAGAQFGPVEVRLNKNFDTEVQLTDINWSLRNQVGYTLKDGSGNVVKEVAAGSINFWIDNFYGYFCAGC